MYNIEHILDQVERNWSKDIELILEYPGTLFPTQLLLEMKANCNTQIELFNKKISLSKNIGFTGLFTLFLGACFIINNYTILGYALNSSAFLLLAGYLFLNFKAKRWIKQIEQVKLCLMLIDQELSQRMHINATTRKHSKE